MLVRRIIIFCILFMNILTVYIVASDSTNKLTDMGIIFNYSAEDQITRAEMVKMTVQFMGLEEAVNNYDLNNIYVFNDVTSKHWAASYIAIAKQQGIIEGDEQQYFFPDKYITYGESVKIIVASLGYSPLARMQGGYPEGYIEQGKLLGILDIIPAHSMLVKAEILRQMLLKSLICPMLVQKSSPTFDYCIYNGKNENPLFTAEMRFYGQNFYLLDENNYVVLHNRHFETVSMAYDKTYSTYYLSLTLNTLGKERIISGSKIPVGNNELYLKVIYNNQMMSHIYLSDYPSDTYHVFVNLSKQQMQELIEYF